MLKIIKQHLDIIINTLVCAVMAFPFGLVSGHLVVWTSAGLLVGLILGLLNNRLFQRLTKYEKLFRRRLVILVLAEALLAIYVVIPGYGAYRVVHPYRYSVDISPADIEIAYENITLTTSDGIELSGWYVPSKNEAAVIIVHSLQGNRTVAIHHLQVLAEQGYGVLAFDLRAHGESGGDRFAAGWDSDKDVLAAITFLTEQADIEPDRIGALGLSVGANVILYTAAHDETIQALWADGTGVGRIEDLLDPLPPEFRPLRFMSPVYWMYDRMIEIISEVPARPPIKEEVRLISPRAIHFVSAGQGWEQFQARKYAASAGDNALILELPDAIHTNGLRSHTEEYSQQMISFFAEHLLSR